MSKRALVIGIAGGSGAGKTTFSTKIRQALGTDTCGFISQDNYYIDQSAHFVEDGGAVNFDDPAALEFTLLEAHLGSLCAGSSVEIPSYDFASHTRAPQTFLMEPSPIILVDGTLILSKPAAISFFDIRIFIDIAEDIRFERRLRRDTRERGRTEDGVRAQWASQVKPMHDQYVQPCAELADYVITDDVSWNVCLREILSRLG
ncbi:MAG: uridine kinase [Deltaproteobacteria bacterium]|jgi:uridine kinase|nr:uridine kinase [Deltaproteobacteria bacterium]MBT6432768.1 uridine kinase [Deltaproteobacteria bacterium]